MKMVLRTIYKIQEFKKNFTIKQYKVKNIISISPAWNIIYKEGKHFGYKKDKYFKLISAL